MSKEHKVSNPETENYFECLYQIHATQRKLIPNLRFSSHFFSCFWATSSPGLMRFFYIWMESRFRVNIKTLTSPRGWISFWGEIYLPAKRHEHDVNTQGLLWSFPLLYNAMHKYSRVRKLTAADIIKRYFHQ